MNRRTARWTVAGLVLTLLGIGGIYYGTFTPTSPIPYSNFQQMSATAFFAFLGGVISLVFGMTILAALLYEVAHK